MTQMSDEFDRKAQAIVRRYVRYSLSPDQIFSLNLTKDIAAAMRADAAPVKAMQAELKRFYEIADHQPLWFGLF